MPTTSMSGGLKTT